jgi:triosephosphate isomerase (TIM)
MKYFFANWKMYHGHDEEIKLIDDVSDIKVINNNLVTAYFPNDLALEYAVQKLGKDHVGAQDVSWASEGANTGEISAHIYKDMGVSYALVGHSEQRHKFGETNEIVRKKLEACLASNLTPILCIGETKEQQEAGKTEEVLKEQIKFALENIDTNNNQLFIAYEPVWAIGSGNPCSAQKASEVIAFVKKEVSVYIDTKSIMLYGGSVNIDNVVSYFESDQIDGLLVGGASSKLDSLSQMFKAISN